MSDPAWAQSLDAFLAYHRHSDRGRVAELWVQGKDTLAIAQHLELPEPYICQLIAQMQDERHAARTKGGAGA